ncbi:hypothetical protein OB920_13185 [Halobacteria archaeon HArc-gm2]|nr:hypothetical protein [Halobacteria archaeon HArc-gm2]
MAEQFEEVHEQLTEVDETLDSMADEINEIVNDAIERSAANVSYDLDEGLFSASLPVEEITGRISKRLDPPFFVSVDGSEIVIKDIREEYDIDDSMFDDQRERIQNLKGLISKLESQHDEGAPEDKVLYLAEYLGMSMDDAKDELLQLKQKGEVYEPRTDRLRTT